MRENHIHQTNTTSMLSNRTFNNASNNKQNTLPSPPPSSNQPSLMTNEQHKFCGAIIRNLKRHRDAAPFLKPVDYVKLNVPDYPSIIQHPMDLSIVHEKLNAKEYGHVDEFISDVRLIFNNCYKFNGPEALVSVLCQNVESAFEKSLRQMPYSKHVVEEMMMVEDMIGKEPSPPLSQHNSPPPTQQVENDLLSASSRPKREIHCPSKDYPQTFTTQRKLSLANKTTQMKYCFQVIKEFKKNKYRDQMYPFLLPVDPIALNIPDYPTIVKHPMDLSTIENKLLNDEYNGPLQFQQDVKLMFDNCYLYNPSTLPIYSAAKFMEKVFDDKWEQRPLEEEVVMATKKPSKKQQQAKRRVEAESEEDEGESEGEEEEEDDKLAQLERHLQTITQQIESMKKPTSKKASPPPKRKRVVKKKPVVESDSEDDEKVEIYGHQQKVTLSECINELSADRLNGVVEIIQANMPSLQGNGNNEIELDMESLDTKTLIQLHNYVFPDDQIHYKQPPQPKRRGRKPNPNNTLGRKKQKREHFSEDAAERKIKALEATLKKFKSNDSSSSSSSESEDDGSDSSSSSDSD